LANTDRHPRQPEHHGAPIGRSPALTSAAVFLMLAPLVHWLAHMGLAHQTAVDADAEPDALTVALSAMFQPGNVFLMALGWGLLNRRRWAYWGAIVTFTASLLFSMFAVLRASEMAMPPGVLWLLLSSAIAVLMLLVLTRPAIRREFSREAPTGSGPRPAPRIADERGPGARMRPMLPTTLELVFTLAALGLVWRFWNTMEAQTLLAPVSLPENKEADAFLRRLVFAAVALLIGVPHVLAGVGSCRALLGHPTARVTRGHCLAAVWGTLGTVLVLMWLTTHEAFAFDGGQVQALLGFCAVTVVWHVALLIWLVRLPGAGGGRGRELRR
jgi:hypothetical protein